MEDLKDSLKQFIESRLQEARRLQALYPDHFYVSSPAVRKLNSEQMDYLLMSVSGKYMPGCKNEFKW